MSFDDLKGQDEAAAFLKKAVEKNRLPHALLFLGDAPASKTQALSELVKYFFCDSKSAERPCGVCVSCRQTETGSHPDLHWVKPEEDSRVLKIDAVRTLLAEANLKPFQATCKFFVLEQAETLNEAAQNALLKTLEEPPAHTYFVFLCGAPEKLLPTVRSRMQDVRFRMDDKAEQEEGESERLTNAFLTRLLQGPSAQNPDLTGVSREELIRLFSRGIREMRDGLMLRLDAAELASDGGDVLARQRFALNGEPRVILDKIEILAGFIEKTEHAVNTKLICASLWEEL